MYYAHLASARARAHEVHHDAGETATTTSAGDSSSAMPTEFEDLVPLGPTLDDQMWYI